MSEQLDLDTIERRIASAQDKNDHRALQRLYLARERAHKRQFEESIKRRAARTRDALDGEEA